MAKPKPESQVRIVNRRATHDYFIEAKVECGVVLVGTEVKTLRDGLGQINDAFAQIRQSELYLVNSYIDPYTKAAIVYKPRPTPRTEAADPQARAAEARSRARSERHHARAAGDVL